MADDIDKWLEQTAPTKEPDDIDAWLEATAPTAPEGMPSWLVKGAKPSEPEYKPKMPKAKEWDKGLTTEEVDELKRSATPEPLGKRLGNLAAGAIGAVAEAPFHAAQDPLGAARAVKTGTAGGASLGLLGPEQTLQTSYENLRNVQRLHQAGMASGDALRQAERDFETAEANAEAAEKHKAARFVGEALGGAKGAGGTVFKGLSRGLPGGSAVERIGRTGVAAGAAGMVEGTGRALVEGESAGEALEAGVDAAGIAGIVGAGGSALAEGLGAGLRKVAGERIQGTARKGAIERLQKAQETAPKDSGEDLAKQARRLGPVVAESDEAGAAAIRTQTAAEEAAAKALTKDALDKLKEGAQNQTKRNVFGPRGRNEPAFVEELNRNPELRAAIVREAAPAWPPRQVGQKALDIVDNELERLGDVLDEQVYSRAQGATAGVPLTDMRKRLGELEKRLRANPANRKLADFVAEENDAIAATFKDTNVVKQVARIPLQSVREMYRAYQDRGFGGNVLNPTEQKELQREISSALRGSLHDEIERVAARNPSMGPLRKTLQETNKRVSALKGVQKILEEKASRQVSASPVMGEMLSPLKKISEAVQKTAAAAGSGVATRAAISMELSRLARAAQTGTATKAMAESALKAGAPAAVVNSIMKANVANGGEN